MSSEASLPAVPLRAALRVWVRVAALSFGGPAGQIAVMHRILVDEKRWIDEQRFLHALNYCMLLPGPEAQQLATYIGWLMHKTLGGLVAGVLFVLPGFVSILALSILYVTLRGVPAVEALFFGLKPAVMAIVVAALIRIGKRALRGPAHVAISAGAFVAIFVFTAPFPWIVAAAALLGIAGGRLAPRAFGSGGGAHGAPATANLPAERDASARRPPIARTLRVATTWLGIWLVPLGALHLWLGGAHALTVEGSFFSKVAVVTFGGAYSVLSYVAQQAVDVYGWLTPAEMLDGLGMAETTPGPLIQVVQFVGFLGAHRNPGGLEPMTAAILGSVVTTWVTFAPCFLWIFLGAPYIEYLRGHRALDAALSAITAAVVGVIANLALWFALHTLFAKVDTTVLGPMRLLVPRVATLDPAAALIAAGAALVMLRFKVGMLATLAASVATGAVYYLLVRATRG